MTSRQTLSTRKRRVRLIALAGFVVFIGSLTLLSFDPISASNLDPLRAAGLILGFAGLGAALVSLTLANLFAFRCPSCRENLAPLVEPLGPLFAVDHRIKCCPFCRADLDSELLPGKPQIDPAWDL